MIDSFLQVISTHVWVVAKEGLFLCDVGVDGRARPPRGAYPL